jgi:hypothetical protein
LTNPNANGECGPINNKLFGTPVVNTHYATDAIGGWRNRPYTFATSAGVQHELRSGMSVSANYYRTSYGNLTVTANTSVTPANFDPYCVTAPVDQRLPGGGGNQICGLYDVNPAKFGQVNNLITPASHYGNNTDVYNGFDAGFNLRFRKGGLVQGGVSGGREVIDNCALVDNPQRGAAVSAVGDRLSFANYCHVVVSLASQTQVKVGGVSPLPWWGLQLSANYQNLPGRPITAQYIATSAQIAPSLGRNLAAGAVGTAVIDLVPLENAKYEDRIGQLDFRLMKVLRIGRARVLGSFDIYNLLNANPVTGVNTRYGAAWLTPTAILAPRLLKFGTQIDF